jgi:hypothetical protein
MPSAKRAFAFFEAYFSNFIEGTEFEAEEAEEIVFVASSRLSGPTTPMTSSAPSAWSPTRCCGSGFPAMPANSSSICSG